MHNTPRKALTQECGAVRLLSKLGGNPLENIEEKISYYYHMRGINSKKAGKHLRSYFQDLRESLAVTLRRQIKTSGNDYA